MLRAIVLAVLIAAPLSAQADSLGLGLPRGSRALGDRYVSSRGFRDSCDHFVRTIGKSAVAHHVVPPTRIRGVDLCRVRSDDRATLWLAVHVYRLAGKTMIYVVPRPIAAAVPPQPAAGP